LARVVFDTNVLVSAALSPESVPGRALTAAEGTSALLASAATFEELESVLSRPKFGKLLSIDARLNYVRRYRAIAEPVQSMSSIAVCRDPRDNKFLEVAVDGHADVIVSGDEDLLLLDPFQGIRILTPQSFLAAFAAPRSESDPAEARSPQ
jgi:putative PIN family toxin of toxin-antitoxin system